jgi:putative flippase GtrA
MFQSVARREGLRQFIKFCIVGVSSTLIDLTIYLFLIEVFHLQRFVGNLDTARIAAQSISFVFAVSNGFFWNNRWTFRAGDTTPAKTRYGKFVLTNLIGLSLNLLILRVVAHSVPPAIERVLDAHLHDPAGFVGKVTATFVVVFWNFCASKYWTFKR